MVTKGSTKAAGEAGEARALAHLLAQGLTLVQRNYRVARGPHARGGEVDLIMRERDGTLVFVEVRARTSTNTNVPSRSRRIRSTSPPRACGPAATR